MTPFPKASIENPGICNRVTVNRLPSMWWHKRDDLYKKLLEHWCDAIDGRRRINKSTFFNQSHHHCILTIIAMPFIGKPMVGILHDEWNSLHLRLLVATNRMSTSFTTIVLLLYHHIGWMSQESANIYETSTETLFLGRQDSMQRISLAPILDRVKELQDMDQPLRVMEIACLTGRFMTFVRDNLLLRCRVYSRGFISLLFGKGPCQWCLLEKNT